ncbi:NAD-dependent epimerase/dehydratase family protein [Mycobacterium sp. PS03-16]|uniref:NAD-dependent epimerase/dehydratase family protein n=1 Tax=Mycobacterium sp. PS03-16 TaxID=2559611 RepID=UPI0010731D8A|nr:NAD-dependent epimerase/dehydratase family protein [Mycobacterium sp. PS03-16]TFV56125.1 NAD-dependent epimerase/dehydratase family protein [Mycobacterium sp. PS03-16]
MSADVRRIVVTGASGNVGTGVLRALAAQLPDAEVVGVCRRPPTHGEVYARVRWHAVDLSSPAAATELAPALAGADVVVHLALAIQPVADEDYLYRANVLGTQALLDAMVAAGVGHLVYASSLGIYAPGPAPGPVKEDWPDTGQATSTYSRHKVQVERMLDRFVADRPDVVVGRFRPTVVVQRQAAWMIKALYLGPLVPRAALRALRRRLVPVVPLPQGLALQFVHADDVGDAVVKLITRRVAGSFNIAADVLDAQALAALVGGRPVGVSRRAFRSAVSALYRMRLLALTPGWYDVATATPVMDTTKARRDLGWIPARSSTESARELIEGLAEGTVGLSAATGYGSAPSRDVRGVAQRVHDVSLLLWSAAALARAVGVGRAGAVDAAVIATNLAAGTPMALDRVRQKRRDPVALVAPVAVLASLGASLRGGWAPVAATAVLRLLNTVEHNRQVRELLPQEADAPTQIAEAGVPSRG